MSELLYVYGFVPRDFDAAIDVRGIGGSPVELIDADDAPQAVISRLDALEYSAETIDARMNDLAWVAEQGVAHEGVVAWFIDHAEILPAPLFTLYSSEDAVRGVLHAQRERLNGEMTRLRGLREWDVKISYERGVLTDNAARFSPAIADLDREIEAAPPGRQYLLRRKREDVLRHELVGTARSLAAQVMDGIREVAREVVTLPPPRQVDDAPVVLNAALLVASRDDRTLIDRLEAARTNWKDAGLNVEFSGPWAPYRFIKNE